MSTTPRTDDMSEPMPFRSMSLSESEVRRALVSMTAERDALVDKYQTAISCLADERRKKQDAIGDRDEWEKRYDEQTKLASEVITQRDALKAAVITKWCSCGAPLTACGAPDSDGEPTWDCNLCMVRSQRDEALRALAAMQLDRDTLKAALKALLNHYVALVNSGDAGNWNPELETPVIRARAALGKGRKP